MIFKTIGSGGDFADIGSAWAYLDTIPYLNDDYTFTIISDFTENNGVAPAGDVDFNGHTVQFINPLKKVIINNGKGYNFRHYTTGVTNHLILDGLIIKQTENVANKTLIITTCNSSADTISVTYKNLILIGKNRTDGNNGIIPILGCNNFKMSNCIIYNFYYGLTIYHYFTTVKNPSYIENVTVYNCSTGVRHHFGGNSTTATWYAQFKNLVSFGSSVSDFINGDGAGNVSYNRVINCADSDNSIASSGATLSNNITGITDLDFLSVDPDSADFLKIGSTSLLYKTGTPNISAWNTSDAWGYTRPHPKDGTVCIGVHEGRSGKIIYFTDASKGPVVSREYDFGDGSAHSTEANPVHEFPEYSTQYNVTLTVRDAIGRSSSTIKQVTTGSAL